MDKVRTYQFSKQNSAALLSIETTYATDSLDTQPQQISLPLTPLVGRKQEVREVCLLLRRKETRLLTLAGPGGVGKTRLAQQILRELSDEFADGAQFVPLASVNAPGPAIATILQALGTHWSKSHASLVQLKSFLREKHFLLVLDNFEQILPLASQLVELLMACPRLKILVTSRAILHVQGEFEFPVVPLALPDLRRLPEHEKLAQIASVALFIQRVQSIQRDFRITDNNAATIAKICTRLDGLPLAIELAAARTKLLSPQALLARLEHRLQILTSGGPDLPMRQQTMHNTIRWSYELLSVEQQMLFRRLSVFVDGSTLDAIEAISTASGDMITPVLDLVTSLVDESLLQCSEQEDGEPRLFMLETIREYALERLQAHGELELTRDAHAAYYLALAKKIEPLLPGMPQGTAFKQMQQEYENAYAALNWTLQRNEASNSIESMLRLATALGQVWFMRGYLHKGRALLKWSITASKKNPAAISAQVKANALYVAGRLAFWQDDNEQAIAQLEEALSLYRQLGDQCGIAGSLNMLGVAEMNRCNLDTANVFLEEGLSLCRKLACKAGSADILLTLGTQALFIADFVRSQSLCQESMTLFHELGDIWSIATNLYHLSWIAYEQGDHTTALRFAEESVDYFRTLGNPGLITDALTLLANIVSRQGDDARASSLLAEALISARELENKEDIALVLCARGRIALRQNNITQACSFYEECWQILRQHNKLALRRRYLLASCLEGMAEVALAQKQPVWTILLYAAAKAVRTLDDKFIPLGIERPSYERTLADAQAQIAKSTFMIIWAEGLNMTPEQAFAAVDHLSETIQIPRIVPLQSALSDLLTARENEVLRLLAEGMTNQQIADQLVISPHTVSIHVRSIYSKLGISSRSAATRYAIEQHLA